MEKAKAAVGSFLNKDGKHDTTVHESVNPAVQNEHVTRTQHEDVTKAVDREVHQDHFHTTVQPVKDKEILPEQHHHKQTGVEHREINHGDDSHIKQRVQAEAAQFKSTREVGDVQQSQSGERLVGGEHVHHHVHENIQPVIQKETIQPSVVHTTIPVHEVHHNEAKHHTASALPAVSMDDFKRSGGHVSGRDERVDAFQGEPKSVGGTLGGQGARGTTSLTEREGQYSSTHGTSGLTGSGNHGTHGNSGLTGSNTHGSSGLTGSNNNTHGSGGLTSSSHAHDNHTDTKTKPSLMDKLNPKKDADGDGKAGFLK